MAGKQKRGGRYTPKGGPAKAKPAPPRRDRPSDDQGPPQVGRRPSPPWFLFMISALWIIAAVVVMVRVDASWKLVPAVVFFGVGSFYLRGALQTVVRQARDDIERDGRG